MLLASQALPWRWVGVMLARLIGKLIGAVALALPTSYPDQLLLSSKITSAAASNCSRDGASLRGNQDEDVRPP